MHEIQSWHHITIHQKHIKLHTIMSVASCIYTSSPLALFCSASFPCHPAHGGPNSHSVIGLQMCEELQQNVTLIIHVQLKDITFPAEVLSTMIIVYFMMEIKKIENKVINWTHLTMYLGTRPQYWVFNAVMMAINKYWWDAVYII